MLRPALMLTLMSSSMLLASCYTEEKERTLSCAEAGVEDGGTEDGADLSGEMDETGTAPAPVGAPCEQNEACQTNFCITTDFVQQTFQVDWEIPSGFCSKMGCQDDAECGESGSCFDSQPFSGMPVKLCLHLCKSFTDCRYGEGYACFRLEEQDEEGACLPANLIELILCGDGVCDESEKTHPEDCPEDCG